MLVSNWGKRGSVEALKKERDCFLDRMRENYFSVDWKTGGVLDWNDK